jgi:hypothetical protein
MQDLIVLGINIGSAGSIIHGKAALEVLDAVLNDAGFDLINCWSGSQPSDVKFDLYINFANGMIVYNKVGELKRFHVSEPNWGILF